MINRKVVRKLTKRTVAKKGSKNANFISPSLQRKCEKCEEEEKVQKKADVGSKGVAATTGSFIQSLPGKGSRLSVGQQQFFGKRMGHDFSDVQIHSGPDADSSSREMNALAYTVGNHIVFKHGMYNPATTEGKKLLAHELTHVMQQRQGLLRKEADAAPEEEAPLMATAGSGPLKLENTRHFANCAGVSVQGHTDANYSHSFDNSGSGRAVTGAGCEACAESDCVVNTGTIVSTFDANPAVTLPAVPAGLNECEHTAVQTFIDTTLAAHEQAHVSKFNRYKGTVRTPYSYRGCAGGLDTHIENIHNTIEAARRASADAASAALDPFNPTIPCNCPDPAPETSTPDSE